MILQFQSLADKRYYMVLGFRCSATMEHVAVQLGKIKSVDTGGNYAKDINDDGSRCNKCITSAIVLWDNLSDPKYEDLELDILQIYH
jgi:hypothetical protein